MKFENSQPIEEDRPPRPLQRVKRILARLWTLKERFLNRDFRDFAELEYQRVSPKEIQDLQRLKYLRNLDLAKTGYANTSITDLISYYRKKERLLRTDQETVPLGHIKVKENGTLLLMVRFGYLKDRKETVMAFRSHDNIPMWRSLDQSKLLESLSGLYPRDGDSLEFGHSFFSRDVQRAFPSELESIGENYDQIITRSFKANKYFEKGIVPLSLELLNNPSDYLDRPVLFPFPQNGHVIMRMTEANGDYLVFQSFLKTAPKPDMLYFTQGEIHEIFRNGQVDRIDQVAKLKFGLSLGTGNGQLYIGKENDGKAPTIIWETFQEAMESPFLNSRVKYYLAKKIIREKDFVIERGAIRLENGNRTAFLKRHYKNGQWYYAETCKKDPEPNFRPVQESTIEHLRTYYAHSNNLHTALNAIRKPNMDKNKIENPIRI